MRIKLASIRVDNQNKALKFYTQAFGFVKKHDIPVGEYRWITVVSPEGPDDLELWRSNRMRTRQERPCQTFEEEVPGWFPGKTKGVSGCCVR